VFLWLFILLTNNDSLNTDSIPVRDTVPYITNFSKIGLLDTSLYQNQEIRYSYLKGFSRVMEYTPFLLKDKGYEFELLTPYPVCFLINGHTLDHYFLKDFNPYLIPLNFIKSVSFIKEYTNSGIGVLDLVTKINNFDQPYSYLYFTLLGPNTIYNIDFTRALTNFSGIYLSGLYSRRYKWSERTYLRTNSGYINIYDNHLIPGRVDMIFSENDYDTLADIEFNDIALTLGDDFYKTAVFRTYKRDYIKGDRLITYGVNQKALFIIRGFENVLKLYVLDSNYKTGGLGTFRQRGLSFSHRVNHKFEPLKIGLGYQLEHRSDAGLVFNPQVALTWLIFNEFQISGSFGLFHIMPDFTSRYGSDHQWEDIIGNPLIKGEEHLQKEFCLHFRNSKLNLYHYNIKNYIFYQMDSAHCYSAINIGEGEIGGVEGFFTTPPFKNLSARAAFNFIAMSDLPLLFPDASMKLELNWERRTVRSVMEFFIRSEFIGPRNDQSGVSYEPFLIASAGGCLRFLTLTLGISFDNIFDTKPVDFPNLNRHFGMEVMWEFWD
jgi:hypothetical protein